MRKRHLIITLCVALATLTAPLAQAQPMAADAFVMKLSTDVMDAVKGDKAVQGGDVSRIRALVDAKVMPHVNFERMTGKAVGPQWPSATPEQRKRLLEEFKTLLINTYSGAMTQLNDRQIVIKPLRNAPTDDEQVVRSEVRGRGEPIQLDYRLERAGAGWKIYDVNVGSFWLVDAFKGQFAKDLNAGGLDALIKHLTDKNKSLGAATKG